MPSSPPPELPTGDAAYRRHGSAHRAPRSSWAGAVRVPVPEAAEPGPVGGDGLIVTDRRLVVGAVRLVDISGAAPKQQGGGLAGALS